MSEETQTALIADRRVRVHRQTGRNSRVYKLEFSDGERTWLMPLWSVTTLIRGLDKPAIPYWAAKEVAKAAIKDRKHLDADVERYGEDEAVKQLSGAPWKSRSRAGEIGTAVHTLIDAHVRGAEQPALQLADDLVPGVTRRFEQFKRWENEWQPTWHGAEMTVFHPEDGWAGTLDELAELGTRGLGVLDVKNSNAGRDGGPGVYPEFALQIAAYAHAKEIVASRGAWLEPLPMPEVHWGAVLWLAEDRHALVEVDITDRVYRAFRVAAEVWRYQDGPGKEAVIGEQSPAVFGILPTPEEQAAAIAEASS